DSNEPNREPVPFYENGTYVDEWDPDYVRLPCSQSYVTVRICFSKKQKRFFIFLQKNGTQRWPMIQQSLIKLQHLAETHMAEMENIKVQKFYFSYLYILVIYIRKQLKN